MKLRETLNVLNNKRIPMSLISKFYRSVVKQTTLYGSEYWVIDRRIGEIMSVVEMRMFRLMSEVTRKEKIMNEYGVILV